MKIPILGMDPSMNNWGMAAAMLDLSDGMMDDPILSLISPEKIDTKQIRVNSSDLDVCHQLARGVIPEALKAKIIFVEIPVGSQSASGMKAYGMCLGILGVLRHMGCQLIEVTATEVKVGLTGKKNATKAQMIAEAIDLYPNAAHPSHNGKVTLKAEHTADALGAIYAGVKTPAFQQLLTIFKKG